MKASLILLPLLGLTWVFGLFAVNENTVVFAWLFTIFNSLQVRADHVCACSTAYYFIVTILLCRECPSLLFMFSEMTGYDSLPPS